MSATTSTTPLSNFRLIIDAALDEYTKQTGIDLTQNPFAHNFQHSDSPDRILELFQERAKQFKEYRDGNRKLINFLKPAVEVLHALSGTLGEAVGVSCTRLVSPTLLFADYLITGRSHFHQQKQSSSELMFSLQYVPPLSSSTRYL
jgi:fungal STAND N-terminal Goodbye domain